MSKSLWLPLSLVLTALALAGCPSADPKCGDGETECTEDSGTPGADAGTDAGETVPCDGACTGATPVCNEATNTCVSCTATAGCTGGDVCDTSVTGGVCVECLESNTCGSGEVCDTTAKTCVTCTATEGCGVGQVCDLSTSGGQCVTCTASAGCGVDQVCDTSVTGGVCVGCLSGNDCASNVCNTATNTCITCNATAGCGADQVCDTSVAGGECVGCLETPDCTSGVCDVQNRTCVTCTGTEGCAADSVCDTSVAGGACVGCLQDGDCASGVCDVSATTCVTCLASNNAGCAAGQTCDTSMNAAGECYTCRNDGQCATATPATPWCDLAVAGGACVACASDAQCTDPSLPICDATSRNCRAVTPADTSAQIAAVRAASDLNTHMLPITGAIVTYLKPEATDGAGTEGAAFFVQAEQNGPALLVNIDPVTLPVAINAGDQVSFTVNETDTISGGMHSVVTISNLSVDAPNVGAAALAQDVNPATDLVSAVDNHESEIFKGTLTITSGTSPAGDGHVQYRVNTFAVIDDTNLRLRVPTAFAATLDLSVGCQLELNYGPMWRFVNSAQLSAYNLSDFSSINCPAPIVTGAAADSNTQVTVTFDHAMLDSTLAADGSQFTFTGGISATAAVLSSTNSKQVIVTTTAQTGGTAYSVSVASSLADTRSVGVNPSANSANFTGFTTPAVLRINEVNQKITNNRDLIELLVVSAGSTAGITLNSNGSSALHATLPEMPVAAGDIIVVHLTPNTTTDGPNETLSKVDSPAGTYTSYFDTAWDVRGTTTAITNSGQVIRLTSASGVVLDAVPFIATSGSPPGAFTTQLQAAQANGDWLPSDCGGALCTTTSTPNQTQVSVDWTTTGTTVTASSVGRVSATDSNTNADWAVGTPTWGLPNP